MDGLSVKDWGPRITLAGSPANQQPDGSSAVWIRLTQAAASSFQRVKFDEFLWRPAVPSESNLITAAVPQCIIQRPGSYRIFLQSRRGDVLPVGTFLVKSEGFSE